MGSDREDDRRRKPKTEAQAEALRSYTVALGELRERVVKAITRKHVLLASLERQIAAGTASQEELDRLQSEFDAAVAEAESLRQRCKAAELEYLARTLELRVEDFPPAHQAAARAILQERDRDLQTLQNTAFRGGFPGAANGRFLSCERRLELAKAKGDQAEIEACQAAYDAAKAEMECCKPDWQAFQRQARAIREHCEAELAKLV